MSALARFAGAAALGNLALGCADTGDVAEAERERDALAVTDRGFMVVGEEGTANGLTLGVFLFGEVFVVANSVGS